MGPGSLSLALRAGRRNGFLRRPSARRARHLPWLAALVIAAGAVTAFQEAGGGLARRAGVVPAPQRYTELFFTAASRLPPPSVHERAIDVGFTVVNREGHLERYRWSVEVTDRSRHLPIGSGSLEVVGGERRRVPLTVVLPPSVHDASTVRLELHPTHETLTVHVAGA